MSKSFRKCIMTAIGELQAKAEDGEVIKLDSLSREQVEGLVDNIVQSMDEGRLTPELVEHKISQMQMESARFRMAKLAESNMVRKDTARVKVTNAPMERVAGVVDSLAQRQLTELRGGTTKNIVPFKDVTANRLVSEQYTLHNRLLDVIAKTQHQKWGVWAETDAEYGDAIIKELGGIRTGLRDAEDAAAVIRGIETESLARLRAVGVYVAEIANHRPRKYSLARISKTDGSGPSAEFVTEMRDKLDPVMHPDLDLSINEIYNSIRKGQLDTDASSVIISHSREVHFKSAQAEYDIMKKFSGEESFSMIMSHLDSLARKVVMAEQHGPSPATHMRTMLKVAAEMDIADGANVGRVNKDLQRGELRVKILTGEFDNPANQTYASAGRSIRLWLNVAHLGGVVEYATHDFVMTGWNTAGLNTKGSKQGGYVKTILTLAESMSGDGVYMRKLAEYSGSIQTHQTAAIIDRIAPVEAFNTNTVAATQTTKIERAGAKALAALFRFTGASKFFEGMQVANATMYLRSIADHVDMSFKQLEEANPTLHSRMKESGVNDVVWREIAKKDHVDTRTGMLDFSKMENRTAINNARSFMQRESSISVTTPDIIARHIATPGRSGTKAGEVFRTMLQYQAIQAAVVRNSVDRALREGTMSVSKLFGMMMLMTLPAVQIEQVVDGKPLYGPESLLWYTKALTKSGLLWIIGALAHSTADTIVHGGQQDSLVDMMGDQFGPAVGLVSDGLIRPLSALGTKGELSKSDQVATTRALMSVIPARSFIGLSGLVTRAQNELLNDLDRSRIYRTRRRYRKERRLR